MWIAADIEPVIAKDYVPPWARGDIDYNQLTVCRSITSVGAQQGAVWRAPPILRWQTLNGSLPLGFT